MAYAVLVGMKMSIQISEYLLRNKVSVLFDTEYFSQNFHGTISHMLQCILSAFAIWSVLAEFCPLFNCTY